jgi:hypothetical protein
MPEKFTDHDHPTKSHEADSHEFALADTDAPKAPHETAPYKTQQIELAEEQTSEKQPEAIKLLPTEKDAAPLQAGEIIRHGVERAPTAAEEQIESTVTTTFEQRAETKAEVGPETHTETQPGVKPEKAASETEKARLNPLERLAAEEAAAQAESRSGAASGLNISHELESITVNRELQTLRRKLPRPQRALSRLIHQPAVRIISEIASKTVSRPSGLLGGSLVAFLGTTTYLYLAKHDGFTYNYLVFLALFVGGFVIGLGLELAVHLARPGHRHASDE